MKDTCVPLPPDAATRRRMKATRQRGTSCEMELRRELFRRGLRYRVNLRRSGTMIDIAFTRLKLAIFCDGCFWHRCPSHRTIPKRNTAWWKAKLQENSERDGRLRGALRSEGWTVLRVWEHEPPHHAAARIIRRIAALA